MHTTKRIVDTTKNYWQLGDYIGIGAGAHSKVNQNKKISRHWNHKHPKQYLKQKNTIAGEHEIKNQSIVFEYFMNRMRMNSPISEDEFSNRTDLCFNDIERQLQTLTDQGLLSPNPDITLTDKGHWFLNQVLQCFLK